MSLMVRSIRSRRRWVTALAVGASLVSTQALAQFGGFGGFPSIPTSSGSSSGSSSDGCPKGKKKSGGSAILGGFIGQSVGRAASSAGVGSYFPSAEVADTLTNAIACRLDPEEQKQAAAATLEATRGSDDTSAPEVGQSSSWTSQTRENVSGTSTVTARNDPDSTGMQCITVTDVIIVNGEETTADKRMCRPPGSARYSLMA